MTSDNLAQTAYEAFNNGLTGSQKSTVGFSQLAPEIQTAWARVVNIIKAQAGGEGETTGAAHGSGR